MKWRRTAVVTTVLLVLSLTFGLVMAANAVTPAEKKAADEYRANAAEKVARLSNSRITQEQREAAAAQVKLMKALAAIGTSGTPKAAAPAAGKSVVVAAAPPPGPGGVPDYFGSTPTGRTARCCASSSTRCRAWAPSNANNLGQYIGGGQARHHDLSRLRLLRDRAAPVHASRCTPTCPPRRLRGYVQVNKGTDAQGNNTLDPDPIRYLGPIIVATKDRPVRIKFTNKLPTGEAGDLFIPVDTSVMGAGEGPDRRREVHAEPRARCTSTAASPRGSATARRTSGSRPPARTRRTPRASASRTCPTCPTPATGR